jgi:hypothetical protein
MVNTTPSEGRVPGTPQEEGNGPKAPFVIVADDFGISDARSRGIVKVLCSTLTRTT